MNKKVLVTGASGFIGSFLVEGALHKGMEAWAGMRQSSSRRFLSDERIRFITLDLNHPARLHVQLREHKAMHGAWDYVIHCAGVTKCLHKEEFEQGNYQATVNLVEALRSLDMIPTTFAYISSLSILGPIREQDYSTMTESDTPQPNTAYGRSKWKTEQWLHSQTDIPTVIYRPTGVYGPREADYFLMAKSIQNHIDIEAGFRRQDLTFVYVEDLVQAVYLGLGKPEAVGRSYFVSDGEVYRSSEFSDLIRKELGNPFVLRFRCPLWLLYVISLLSETVNRWLGKPSTLNTDKYRIMCQRNWRCDISPLQKELGYSPQYPLKRGVPAIISWYKQAKWL